MNGQKSLQDDFFYKKSAEKYVKPEARVNYVCKIITDAKKDVATKARETGSPSNSAINTSQP